MLFKYSSLKRLVFEYLYFLVKKRHTLIISYSSFKMENETFGCFVLNNLDHYKFI